MNDAALAEQEQHPPVWLEAKPRAGALPEGRHDVWAIVLAGGAGGRLRPLVRRLYGDERPKQYVKLLGPRTLLRQTLDRIGLGIPAGRTVVVTVSRHARYMAEEFSGSERPHVLVQPSDRGTAVGTLYGAHRIAWRDPDATVAVFPSDHLILAEAAFMAHVGEIAAWVDRHPERMVLLGAPPSSPEVEYGWIEPGDALGEVSTGAVCTVRQFVEKPSLERARACLGAGHLWNTSVIIAKVATLLRIGRDTVPELSDRMARTKPFVGTPDEAAAAHQAYLLMPRADFSRSILEACPAELAVSQLPRLGWSDLGSPRRAMEARARLGVPTGTVRAALTPRR